MSTSYQSDAEETEGGSSAHCNDWKPVGQKVVGSNPKAGLRSRLVFPAKLVKNVSHKVSVQVSLC